jgi:hypothetical protein
MRASTWTKSEMASTFADCATLRDVITKLEVEMSAQGEVICEIRVNDIALSEEDEAQFADCALADLQSLQIQSNRPLDLVRDALKSAVELMPGLEKSALVTAELLRAGEAVRAAKGFEETVAGCQWLVETLLHVRGASDGIGKPITQIDQWMESEKLIGRVVTEVSEAHSRADSILVADLLEYEMTAALASWKSTIEVELDRRLDANP